MNLRSLCLYCDLRIEKARAICPDDLANYIELLYRVARTGGHTTKEEAFPARGDARPLVCICAQTEMDPTMESSKILGR